MADVGALLFVGAVFIVLFSSILYLAYRWPDGF